MLKNVIFDFGNVIIDFSPDKILNNYDVTSEERELFKKEIFNSEEWLKIDAGELTEDEATEIFKNRLPQNVHAKVDNIMTTWPENVVYFSEIYDLMKNLHEKGHHLYALSNTGMRFANYLMSTKYGKFFEGTIFSAQEKLMKPDHKIYQTLVNRYKLVPEESLFIDDRPENIQAANDIGINGFVFNISKLDDLKKYIQKLN